MNGRTMELNQGQSIYSSQAFSIDGYRLAESLLHRIDFFVFSGTQHMVLDDGYGQGDPGG